MREYRMLAMYFLVMIILVIVFGLAGCTARPLQVTAPCPKPNIPAEPHYPMQDLKQGDSHATVAKAYAASFQLAYDYIHEQLLPIMKVNE